MSHENQIKIVEGDEAKKGLDDRALIHFVNRVNKLEVQDTVGEQCHEIATRIHQSLGEEERKRALIDSIDPAFDPIEHMKDLRQNGQIAIAKDGDRTVGMAGFERCGTDPKSGRDVYEVRRIGVRKEDEKRGIGGQLHRTIFERVRVIDPQALILVEAWDQVIMNQCKKMKYKECDVYDGLVRKGYREDRARALIPWYQEKGYKFFVYDSSKAKASDTSTEEGGSE